MVLLFLMLCLGTTIVLGADSNCEIGDVHFTGFNITKFFGPWVWLYQSERNIQKTYGCITDNFIKETTKVVSTTVDLNNEKNNSEHFSGFVKEWNNNSYFHDFDDPSSPWRCVYYIMGTDYNGYVVLKGCLQGYDHPTILVGFRNSNPSDQDISNANKTLSEYGMTINDLLKFNDCK